MGANGFSILIVEDSAAEAELIQRAFQRANPRVRATRAPTAAQAMSVLDVWPHGSDPLSLVLLDLKLPDRSGHEILEQIRCRPALRSIPVVILTGSSDDADRSKSYALGANAHVVKPDDLDSFTQLIVWMDAFWLGLASQSGDGLNFREQAIQKERDADD